MSKIKPSVKYKYAGFWIRLLAVTVDWVILGVIGYIFFGSEVTYIKEDSFGISYRGWKILVPVLYTYISWIWLSATPGKLILRLKIINELDGNKLSWKQSLVRLISYPVSAILLLGFIKVAFDIKKQGWHDQIAKTIVIKEN